MHLCINSYKHTYWCLMCKLGVKSSSGMSADVAKETTEKILKAVGYVRKLQALQTPFSQRFGGKYHLLSVMDWLTIVFINSILFNAHIYVDAYLYIYTYIYIYIYISTHTHTIITLQEKQRQRLSLLFSLLHKAWHPRPLLKQLLSLLNLPHCM